MKLEGKVVALTGAGSGIGRELASQLAQRGAVLALSDQRLDTLEETVDGLRSAGALVSCQQTDVSQPEQMTRWAEAIVNEHGGVDIFISNAGIALPWRAFEDVSYEALRRIVDVNLWGTIHGAIAFLPHLRSRTEASFVTIGSAAGLIPSAKQAGYCTSKFALRGFTESLRMELAGTKIHVLLVLPGGIRNTSILSMATGLTSDEAQALVRLQERVARTTPSRAAACIIKGIERDRKRVLIGFDAAVLDAIARLLPTGYARLLQPLSAKLEKMAGLTTR